MSKNEPQDGTNLDPRTIDLDAWIDGIERPEVTVLLYPYEDDYKRRLAELEAQIPAAEKAGAEDRGIDEPSAEVLLAQVRELNAKRDQDALRVRLRQPLQAELTASALAAKKAGAPEAEWAFWQIATACVEPAFTAAQLKRLKNRDRSGEQMWVQLFTAVDGLLKGLPVPS